MAVEQRILDLSKRPAFLSVRNGPLVIRLGSVAQRSPSNAAAIQGGGSAAGSENGPCATESESGLRSERTKDPNEHAIPLEDIAVIVASHAQITYTNAVLAALASAGGIFIASNEKHMPVAMLLPLESHWTQTERFAKQAQMSEPLRNDSDSTSGH
jgi:hypothetical protein